ncbi:MAG: hypothetical protein IJU81_04630 [Bacteroidales bacterium]|nr:hypothetical protein [Bacteroidales bacterium]
MRKTVLLLLSLLTAFTLQAQKLTDGTLYFLRGEQELNTVFVYERCRFDQKTEKNFVMEMCDAEGDNWQTRWDKEIRPLLEKTFLGTLSESLSEGLGVRCGKLPRATYTMRVTLQQVGSTGYAIGTIEFIENRGGDIIAKMEFNSKGKGNKKDVIDGMQKALQNAASESGKFILKNSKRPAIVYD